MCFDAPLAGHFDGTENIIGTSNSAYSAFDEKDATEANLTLVYQITTCMSAYRGYAFEISLIFPRIASLRSLLCPSESRRRPHHSPTLLSLRRNAGHKTTNKTVRRPSQEYLVPVRLALVVRPNLRQLGACSARSNPQHSPYNLLSVALLDLLTSLLEQGLVRLV